MQDKLIQMQKSTEAQLDETVGRKIETTVPRTVHSILFKDLNPIAFTKSKRRKSKNTSSVFDSNENTKLAQPETFQHANASTNNQQAAPLFNIFCGP